MIAEKQILDALAQIIDPDFQRDIVSLGFVKQVAIHGGEVAFTIELTTPACPIKDQFKAEAERIVAALRQTGGNKAKAARLLAFDRSTLYRKMRIHDIAENVAKV